MKAAAWFAAAAAVVTVAFVLLRYKESLRTRALSPSANITADSRVETPPPPRATTVLPVAETAASLNSPGTDVADDIATLDLLVSEFRKQLGGNPVGENDEITAALLGNNTKALGYLTENRAYIDPGGRLIDRWGTPYFFHAVSGDRMEIISAGPDLRHHTEDDIISE